MENAFYPMVFRQKYIRRWGLMRNMTEETLSEHSYDVAVLTHALCNIGNIVFNKSLDIGRAVCIALFHDVQEVYTGDMPTPAKYYNESMRENYATIEKNATEQLLSKLPAEFRFSYKELLSPENDYICVIVKAADKLSAYIKCVEETKCNNREFNSAKETTYKALCKINCEELSYFIEHFLPAFEEDLDTLQK